MANVQENTECGPVSKTPTDEMCIKLNTKICKHLMSPRYKTILKMQKISVHLLQYYLNFYLRMFSLPFFNHLV